MQQVLNTVASPWAEAAEKEIRRLQSQYLISNMEFKPTILTRIDASGVELTLRYLCTPWERRKSEHRISKAIIKIFNKCDDIDFAYPSHRVFNNPVESKTALREKTEEKRRGQEEALEKKRRESRLDDDRYFVKPDAMRVWKPSQSRVYYPTNAASANLN
jgi:hypothetical protein